jgi:hypothetical protein
MTTNLWTVGQGLVTRRLAPKPGDLPKPGEMPKKTSRTPPKANDGDGAKPAPARPAQQQPAAPKVVRRKKQGRARR